MVIGVEVGLHALHLEVHAPSVVGFVDQLPILEHLMAQDQGSLIEDDDVDMAPVRGQGLFQSGRLLQSVGDVLSQIDVTIQQQRDVHVAGLGGCAFGVGAKEVDGEDVGLSPTVLT